MKKKLISSILAFCMILSLIPMSVFAAAADYKITVTESGGTGHVEFTGATKASNYDYYTVSDTSVTQVSFEVTPPTDYEVKSVTYTVGTGEAQTLDAPYSIKVSDITDDVAIAITYGLATKVNVTADVNGNTATSTVNSEAISSSISSAGSTLVIDTTQTSEDGDDDSSADNVTTAEVSLSSDLKNTLESNDAKDLTIQIETHAGSISMPASELAELLTDDVKLVIDTNTAEDSALAAVQTAAVEAAKAADNNVTNPVVEPISVSFVKSDNSLVTVENKTITLSFPVPSSLSSETNPAVFHVDGSKYTQMEQAWKEGGNIYFETSHLSDFIATDAKTAAALNPEEDDETPDETTKVTCVYQHGVGLFKGQLVLTGLTANSQYVLEQAKVGSTPAGNGYNYTIAVFTSDANGRATIQVLGNSQGYHVVIFPVSGSSIGQQVFSGTVKPTGNS